ncbi:hypothetical protein LTR62_007497 [Meristemomyces frigidus]|uniref:Inositol-pentakisphosphate 2-kinase n=1 Tax=Meristemomyces frigidus TaxID=1508187 RepID=A0AAN7TBK8_9PEZI|nr:hypothetical protein LTR62_007497 [Meristemomyces frigidus]
MDPSADCDIVYYSTKSVYSETKGQAPEGIPFLSDFSSISDSATACSLEYLNEGGANLVFRITPAGAKSLPEALSGRVLRLAKHSREEAAILDHDDQELGAHNPLSEEAQYRYWVKVLGDEAVLNHNVVRLSGSMKDLINSLLACADRSEHRRAHAWVGGRTGFLVEDMTPQEGETLHEFKPKWLDQSPSAPRGATRCRTCALRAMRSVAGQSTATDLQGFCPLYLFTPRAKEALSKVFHDQAIMDHITTELMPMLSTLRDYQRRHDEVGIVHVQRHAHKQNEDELIKLGQAMTARDCTIYCLRRRDGSVKARIGDLDLKSCTQDKVEKWLLLEQKLINGGWYEGEDEVCLLSNG